MAFSNFADIISPQVQTAIAQFRRAYPTGSILAEFVTIHADQFVVRVLVQVGNQPLGSALATGSTVEHAEDRAKLRAIASVLSLHDGVLEPTSPFQPAASPLVPHGWMSPPSPSTPEVLTPEVLTPEVSTQPIGDRHPSSSASISPTSISSTSISPTHVDGIATDDWIHSMDTPDMPPPMIEFPDEGHPLPSLSSEPDPPKLSTHASDTSAVPPHSKSKKSPSSDANTSPDGETRSPKKASKKKSTASQPTPEPTPPQSTGSGTPLGIDSSSMVLTADLSDIIAKTSVELRRLGWTDVQGREHLERVYGKRSRQQLTDPELFDFLTYLESQPTPHPSA